MTIDRRSFLKVAAGGAIGSAALATAIGLEPRARNLYVQVMRPHVGPPLVDPEGTEVLYNGIRLPSPWPPYRQILESQPEFPPYLLQPPPVIPIDVGRQLFVDDFLIEECDLDRSYHSASYIAANPIVQPTTPWERRDEYADRTHDPQRPTAMPFSDGVWFDPADRLFKMWYNAGYGGITAYAVSDDGVRWRKPPQDVVPGTNIVLNVARDSNTVWLDHDEPNPALRYKMMMYAGAGQRLRRYTSPDGIHWRSAGFGGPSGDRSTFFRNPFRNVWVYNIREHPDQARTIGRHRRYVESREFCSLTPWTIADAIGWVGADDLDRPRVDMRVTPQLYNLDCVAYESVLLGLFSMFFGDPSGRHKPNQIEVGFSRDGFHWARPSREPFIGVSEHRGDWNWTNVQSTGGCCLVMGDRLYFYVSGRAGVPGTGSPGVCSTGLATLRRDGFVSLDAPADTLARNAGLPAERARSVTTRPVRFTGAYLFVNVDIDGGELRAEVLDADGGVIEPFSAARCVPIRQDTTRGRVTWSTGPTGSTGSAGSLADLAGETVRFRFYLGRGRLYSFWVSPTERGESRGYVAAGGPAFSGSTDT
ncbi:MAG: glycosyl hydrolase family 32 [Vicinamibacterales bacterium]